MSTPNPSLDLSIKEGIVEYSDDVLAGDPSVVVADPYPPGDTFFYVDDLRQISAGCRVTFSTEAENDPMHVRRNLAELHLARREMKKFPPGSEPHDYWLMKMAAHEDAALRFFQGRKHLRAHRDVIFVNKAKGLIAVNKPFDLGLKPRILGSVFRVLGFQEDLIDEIGTDKMHKEAKKIYGSYDWESEYQVTGKFPLIRG